MTRPLPLVSRQRSPCSSAETIMNEEDRECMGWCMIICVVIDNKVSAHVV